MNGVLLASLPIDTELNAAQHQYVRQIQGSEPLRVLLSSTYLKLKPVN